MSFEIIELKKEMLTGGIDKYVILKGYDSKMMEYRDIDIDVDGTIIVDKEKIKAVLDYLDNKISHEKVKEVLGYE